MRSGAGTSDDLDDPTSGVYVRQNTLCRHVLVKSLCWHAADNFDIGVRQTAADFPVSGPSRTAEDEGNESDQHRRTSHFTANAGNDPSGWKPSLVLEGDGADESGKSIGGHLSRLANFDHF